MGIALGYAFLLAIAGGLIAICFAWLGELIEDSEAEALRADPVPVRLPQAPRRLAGTRASGLHHQF